MHLSVFVCYSMYLSDCYSPLVVTVEQSCSPGVPHQVTDTGVLQLGGDMEPLGWGREGGGGQGGAGWGGGGKVPSSTPACKRQQISMQANVVKTSITNSQ